MVGHSPETSSKKSNTVKRVGGGGAPSAGVVQPNKTHGHEERSQFIFKCGHDEKGHSTECMLCNCTMAILGGKYW